MTLQRPKRSWRLQSALAVVAGAGLMVFEYGRIEHGDIEGYVWIVLAGLMFLLGLAGLFAWGER